MVEKLPITLPALSGKKERNVYVYLPESAKKNPKRRYPVLYMFDGHNVFFDEDATFGKSWGMKRYMDRTRTPLIIVAVECNHGENYARLKEYSPFNFGYKNELHIVGRGEKYMDWLINTLKPITDENYPTLPGRESTFIAGSSMGGLMSLYAVTAHNDVFSRAACLSPSLWTNKKRVLDCIRSSDIRPGTVVYMDYGENEMKRREDMKGIYTSAVKALLDKDVLLTARIVPHGEHCEASWEKQIPLFMRTLMDK
ncbi:MAG: alpha/beta hydrolase [Clostridia bacterium]|nr:alpha/beta hydrolase [Clostridia bacterium]MBR6786705.1 alpha/beta hydrolase [Clostridia bacterium]